MTPSGAYRLGPLELAAGQALGVGATVELPAVPKRWTPLDALGEALRPALERSPCLVSFSGGRDSSAVLAAAVGLARREGLPLPVPITKRYADAPESDETDWQERVVDHLGLDDWIRLELDADEYHMLGPVASGLLRRHGILWPPHLHLQLPTIEAARGGALVTGLGGDEILGGVRWTRTGAVLARERRPTPRTLLGLGYAFAPATVKKAFHRSDLRGFAPWLRRHARSRVRALLAAQAATEPFRWEERLGWWLGRPYLDAGIRNIAHLGRDEDVEVFHPLLDPLFAAAVANLPPEGRYVTRTSAMRKLFGGLLPDAVLTRRSKASFDHIDRPELRLKLVERWSGEGVDPALVDLDVLRAVWSAPESDPSSASLLQSAWLALDGVESGAGETPELVGGRR